MKHSNLLRAIKLMSATTGKYLLTVAETCHDLNFMFAHPSLCTNMSVNEAIAFLERRAGAHRSPMRLMKRKRWIDDRRIGDRVLYHLTTNGRIATLGYAARAIKERMPDDTVVIVIFDIPQSQRVARDQFRRTIKSIGFSYVQQSVWMSKKNVSRILQEYFSLLGIRRWVRVYIGDEVVIP